MAESHAARSCQGRCTSPNGGEPSGHLGDCSSNTNVGLSHNCLKLLYSRLKLIPMIACTVLLADGDRIRRISHLSVKELHESHQYEEICMNACILGLAAYNQSSHEKLDNLQVPIREPSIADAFPRVCMYRNEDLRLPVHFHLQAIPFFHQELQGLARLLQFPPCRGHISAGRSCRVFITFPPLRQCLIECIPSFVELPEVTVLDSTLQEIQTSREVHKQIIAQAHETQQQDCTKHAREGVGHASSPSEKLAAAEARWQRMCSGAPVPKAS